MLRAIAEERGRLSLRREVCGLGPHAAPGAEQARGTGCEAQPHQLARCPDLKASVSLTVKWLLGGHRCGLGIVKALRGFHNVVQV
ncbi:LOW QUALITY PROTEIN: KIAA0930 isoform 2 [Pongo abelii]|uniref:KIAA0930 isoform 2 n=1 Tax=Pongo abelii TaxID=9601 RepID=A0A2J8TW94_PONAB|nr:LOW QUALITY PROTEIN: KIAA0930 isoform 2 [Pongo abelii]